MFRRASMPRSALQALAYRLELKLEEITSLAGFDPTGTLAEVKLENADYWTRNALDWQKQFQRVITVISFPPQLCWGGVASYATEGS